MSAIKKFVSALTGGAGKAPVEGTAFVVAPELLAPVDADRPCGDSLEYDTEYAVLQARLAPRAEVQYGSFSARPEAPDWAEVERDARRLLRKSKDISMLVWFTRARCRLGGAAGLLEGLSTLQAVLQAYPEQVHPQLLLEGVSDPAVRANALAALADPEGLLGDVREVVLTSNTAHRLSVRDVERALAVPRAPYAPDPEVVRRQLADLHARGDASLAALLGAAAGARGIEQWSRAALQDDAPNLAPLLRLLAGVTDFAEPVLRGSKLQADAVEPVEAGGERRPQGPDAGRAAGAPAPSLMAHMATPLAAPQALLPQQQAGVLQEREQIRVLLRQVRLWIEQHEPSSPVTILIKQADRMWGKRFSEIAGMIPPDLVKAWDSDD